MKFCENFLAIVRPNGLYFGHLKVVSTRRKFRVGGVECPDEFEAWSEVVRQYPDGLAELAVSPQLVDRALGRRAEVFLTEGPSAIEGLERRLAERVVLMHDTVIEAFGATRLTRAKAMPRRTKPSRNVTYLHLASRVLLPYSKDENYLHMEACPSPLDPNAFAMRVRLAAVTNQAYQEAQHRLGVARRMLYDRGILVGDVLGGTGMADM